MGAQDIAYHIVKSSLGILFLNLFYDIEIVGSVMNHGPGLLVAPHLFATDPIVIGCAIRHRIKPVFLRQGNDFTQILAKKFGIESNSHSFRTDLFKSYDRNDFLLAFPEGDTPGKFKRKFEKNGSVNPYDVPVTMGITHIFRYSLEYETDGNRIVYQPVGLECGQTKYIFGLTIPGFGTHMVLRFGSLHYSDGKDENSLADELMSEAAALSGRHYDRRLYERRVNSKFREKLD